MAGIDYLNLEDLIEIGSVIIPDFKIRDIGLLESAANRPQTTIYGKDAYPTFADKAAALMHSLARNHCLIDGNKRIAWSATRAFCLMNGLDLMFKIDTAESLVVATAKGELDVAALSKRLTKGIS